MALNSLPLQRLEKENMRKSAAVDFCNINARKDNFLLQNLNEHKCPGDNSRWNWLFFQSLYFLVEIFRQNTKTSTTKILPKSTAEYTLSSENRNLSRATRKGAVCRRLRRPGLHKALIIINSIYCFIIKKLFDSSSFISTYSCTF